MPDWFTPEIADVIRERKRLFSIASKTQLSALWNAYRHSRNRVVHFIPKAKCSFYRDAIRENFSLRTQTLYSGISSSKGTNLPSHLRVEGLISTDPAEISNITSPVKTQGSLCR